MDRGTWWAAVHGVAQSRAQLSNFTFTFHFHALEKEMATHSSVLAWRIPGTGKPGGLSSIGSHRVGHDWSDLAVVVVTHFELDQCIQAWFKEMIYVLHTYSCHSSMLQISRTLEHHVKYGSQGSGMEGFRVPASLLGGEILTNQGQSIKDSRL